eukprot:880333-Pleurochrysis_carterae.AAC.1
MYVQSAPYRREPCQYFGLKVSLQVASTEPMELLLQKAPAQRHSVIALMVTFKYGDVAAVRASVL